MKKINTNSDKVQSTRPDLDLMLSNALSKTEDGKTQMELIIESMIKEAIAGNIRAAELLLDRAYGKVKLENNLTIKSDGAFVIEYVKHNVDTNDVEIAPLKVAKSAMQR